MALVEARPDGGRSHIQSYGGGAVTVSGVVYRTAILILPDRVIADPAPGADIAQTLASPAVQEALSGAGIETVLVGTGFGTAPTPALILALRRSALWADAMESAAACRTFNILMTEDRKAAALLHL